MRCVTLRPLRRPPSLCFQKAFCSHEAHIPAEQAQTQPYTRIPRPHGEPRWPTDPEAAPRQGPRPTHALIVPSTGASTSTHPNRFSARLRLTRGADFDAVFSEGRRSADALFTVLYRHSSLDHPRLGMAASSKRVRTAVGRNRIRRLVRESFRHSAVMLAGLDVVVLVRDAAARAPNPDIAASLAAHWARLNRSVAGR